MARSFYDAAFMGGFLLPFFCSFLIGSEDDRKMSRDIGEGGSCL